MASAAALALATIGVVLLGAFAASYLHRRWRIPDILALLAIGVAGTRLGPVLDHDFMAAIFPLAATLALVIILFDGGLELRITDVRSGLVGGMALAGVVFASTTLLCAGAAHWVAGMDWGAAALLGMCFAGAGVVIVIPLIQQMGVRHETRTIVSIEAAVSDVLVLVGVGALAGTIASPQPRVALDLLRLLYEFLGGAAIGGVAGFVWGRVLASRGLAGLEYVLTLAVLVLAYAGAEVAGASGIIASLAFGAVLGNTTKHGVLSRATEFKVVDPAPVFGEGMAGFHHQALFLVRAFFFVGLGATLDVHVFTQPRLVMLGLGCSVAVVAARWWATRMLFRKSMPAWDRAAVAALFPLGLAAAVASVIPSAQFHLEGTEEFGAVAAIVIVLTNAGAGIAVFFLERSGLRQRPDPMFSK